MIRFEHLAARLYDTPLAVTLERAEAWERVIRARMEGGGQLDELHARTVATERLEALAQANDARPTREGYALTDSGIAVIPIHGGLVQRGGWMESESGLTGYNNVARTLRAAERNPDVHGIVFDIDSPGGEVAGMFELADMIANAGKPTRAIANDVAASAAYTLASAAGKVFATKTAMLGSIGVLAMHVDRSKQHDKAGVKYTPIIAGSRKVEGSSLAPLSDDARSAIQARVDSTYSMLVETVAGYRRIDADDVSSTEGAVMQASDAQNAGLIDGVSTLGQVIHDFAAELDSSSRTEQRPRALTSAEIDQAVINAMVNGLNPKGVTMNDPKTTAPGQPAAASITPEQLASAEAAARASASTAERARVKAILGHPDAKRFDALAEHLAHDTDMAPEAAAVILANAAKVAAAPEPAKATNEFAAAMAKTPNPNISADAPGADPDSPEAAAAAIIAYLPRKRAK